MLNLQSTTAPRWLAQVDENLEQILIDHAHCEKKAAAAAMNFIMNYGRYTNLCREMARIVIEEMEHFRQVLDLLERRGLKFRPQQAGSYGRKLQELVRKGDPGRAVDRLLVAGLIEARSCERFSVLASHIRDAELASFYRSLFESEARHHSTYVRMAQYFADEESVASRLRELAAAEAQILAEGDALPRMHS